MYNSKTSLSIESSQLRKIAPAAGIAMLLVMQPASANVIFETNAEIDSTSFSSSDPKGPTSLGSILSLVEDPSGTSVDFSSQAAVASAAADDTGSSAVSVNGLYTSGPNINDLYAEATFTEMFENTSKVVQNFDYSFTLNGPRLTIGDFTGFSDTSIPTIKSDYEFFVLVDNGGTIDLLDSFAELKGGNNGHNLDVGGTNPLGSTFFADSPFEFGYQFDNLADSISGTILPGDTLTIVSQISAIVETPGFETGAAAAIGDPLNLTGGGFSGELIVTPIPEASTVVMMGLGLAGVAFQLRRRSRSTSLAI